MGYNQDSRIFSLQESKAYEGKLVSFYKNGDIHFKGLNASVTLREFKRFESLLKWLDEKIPTPRGIRHVFQLPEGYRIYNLEEFEHGCSYVVSSTNSFRKLQYGKAPVRYWRNKPPSASRFRQSELSLFTHRKKPPPHSYPASRTSSHQSHFSEPSSWRGSYARTMKPPRGQRIERPRVLNIISNTQRDSREKVIVNPQTTQTYEEMLEDIGSMLQLSRPPLEALWTARKPYKKVNGFAHLLRGLRHFDTYLAVGQEGVPVELEQRDALNPFPATPDLIGSDASGPVRSAGSPDHSLHKSLEAQARQWEKQQQSHNAFKNTNTQGKNKSKVRAVNGYRDPPRLPLSRDSTHSQLQTKHPGTQPKPGFTRLAQSRESVRQSHEQGVVSVDIHGKTREFHVPRYTKTQNDGKKPDRRLKLDWVYGYRGREQQHNLLVLPSGELVYYVAALAVVLHPTSEHQRHYTEHNEDITSIALHPSTKRFIVATGQLSGSAPDAAAHIRVWDANALVTYAIVGFGVFQHAVISLAFSPLADDSEKISLLLAIDKSEKHTMSVWHWQKDTIIAKTSTTTETVIMGRFHPKDQSALVSCGKDHILFWKLFWDQNSEETGKLLRDKESGVYQNGYEPSVISSIAFSESGDVITGDQDGGLVLWQRNRNDVYSMSSHWSAGMRHAHQAGVHGLCVLDNGLLLSAGGHEVKAWDTGHDYQLVSRTQIAANSGSIRALAIDRRDTEEVRLYLGTAHNSVLQGSLQGNFHALVQGDFNDQKECSYERLWALAAHPSTYAFVTAGVDQQVIKWNALTHRLDWRTVVEKPCTSVDFDAAGKVIVVGTTVGRFIVLSALDGMHVFSMQAGAQKLSVVNFSPDGRYLALGSHDCGIYVYSVEDEAQVFRKNKVGILRGHSSFVRHVDWSHDSKHLRSVSGDYDLLFWSVEEMREVTSESVRDLDWRSHHCVLSYHTLGAWSNLKEDEDITATVTSQNKDLLAVGDNQGSIRLYKHPCTKKQAGFEMQKPYTGHVTRVAFTFDDHYLLSSGGTDAALLQWSVTKQH